MMRHPVTGRFMAGDCERDCLDACAGLCGAQAEVAVGDCFIVAWRHTYDDLGVDPTLRLCHGTVVRAEDGKHHPHAWVERTETHNVPFHDGSRTMPVTLTVAIDKANGHDVEMSSGAYRNIGQAYDVAEYTRDEAMSLALRHGHFGPW